MPLPKQVQAQLDAAEALLAAANGQPQPPTPEVPPPPQPPAPPAPALELVPVQAPAAQAPVPPAPAAPQQDVWEQRYKSLQGIHRGMQNQLQQAMDRIAQLERTNSQPPAPAPQPPAPPAQPQLSADPKDVDTFGADLVSYVQRTAFGAIQSLMPQLDTRLTAMATEIAGLKQALQGTTQTVQMTADELFFSELKKQVPNWEQINDDDGFLAYLNEKDPLYGVPRQFALNDAREKGDAIRAAAVFKAYSSLTAPPVAAAPQASPTPRGAASAPPPSAPQRTMITQASVARFYDDCRRGLYRGKDAERLQIEATINLAMAEGRIV